MEEDTHNICFDHADEIWKYVLKKSLMTSQAVVMPRTDAGPGGLEWLRKFKFPSMTTPEGARTQTLDPELAINLFESVFLEVSATLRPSTSPTHEAPNVEIPGNQAPEHSFVAFKEGLATLTHPDGFIGGANTTVLRGYMMVNTDWVAGYRDFKKLRIAIMEKMPADLRSFLANAPVDLSAMPPYVQHSVHARFEVDFMDLKLLYLQAYIFWRKGGLKSISSILRAVKTGQDCLEGNLKRPPT